MWCSNWGSGPGVGTIPRCLPCGNTQAGVFPLRVLPSLWSPSRSCPFPRCVFTPLQNIICRRSIPKKCTYPPPLMFGTKAQLSITSLHVWGIPFEGSKEFTSAFLCKNISAPWRNKKSWGKMLLMGKIQSVHALNPGLLL